MTSTLLPTSRPGQQAKAAPPQTLAARPAFGSALMRQCACGGSASVSGSCAKCNDKRLQRKLTIGSSHDPLELEADRVADQVLRSPSHAAVTTSPPRIQRFTGHAASAGQEAPASVDRVLSGSGKPLEAGLRLDMERRFGHDFSNVRVHSGTSAEQSARDVNANAYTVGRDIVFGASRYEPGTHEGRRLIAHELTHVVQQGVGMCGEGRLRREPRSMAQNSTEGQYLNAVLAYLSTPGLEPNYVDALEVLNGLAMPDILDTLIKLDARGLLDGLLDHYADNQRIGVIRLYVAMRAVSEQGSTNRDEFELEHGVELSGLPKDQQSQVLHVLGPGRPQEAKRPPPATTQPNSDQRSPSRLGDGELIQAYSTALRAQPLLREGYLRELEAEVRRRFRTRVIGVAPKPAAISFFTASNGVALGMVLPLGVSAGEILARNPHLAETILNEMELAEGALGEGAVAEGAMAEGALAEGALAEEAVAAGVATEGAAAGAALVALGAVLFVVSVGALIPGDTQLAKLPSTRRTKGKKKDSYTAPRVEAQTEERKRKNGCYMDGGMTRGGHNCHNAFAMSISGVPREFVLTAPLLKRSESFDAYDKTQTLHEVKTFHRWLAFAKVDNPERNRRIERFRVQAKSQLTIATHCGYPLVWTFNDAEAEKFFDQITPVMTRHVPFECNFDSD